MQSHPAPNMVPEQLELGFAAVKSGHSLSSDNTSEGFVLVNCGTNEMTRIDDWGRPVRDTEGEVLDNLEREKQLALRLTETASSDLPVTCSAHDERINPVLGDVSDWETPWEDLQIGERIGIGKNLCS